jgi:hypothetical protein
MANEQQRAREAEQRRRRAVEDRLARTARAARLGEDQRRREAGEAMDILAGRRAPGPGPGRSDGGVRHDSSILPQDYANPRRYEPEQVWERIISGNVNHDRLPSEADLARRMYEITPRSESGGRHFDSQGNVLRSPKGALGEMQVRRSTGKIPGFGVQPMRNDTREENIRFGRDYLLEMLRHHETNPASAWTAYNWGPTVFRRVVDQYGDDWIDHAPQETMNYLAQNLESLGRPAVDRRESVSVTIPRLTSLTEKNKPTIYVVRGVSEEQRRAIEAALPAGKRLVPRRDGSFTVPTVYRKPVQAAVNRIANPLISQVANEWEQAIRAADAQRR